MWMGLWLRSELSPLSDLLDLDLYPLWRLSVDREDMEAKRPGANPRPLYSYMCVSRLRT